MNLKALVAALADETEWEEPGEIGAPPFYFTVAGRAADELKGHAREVLPELTEVMRRSLWAAHAGMQLLAECGEEAVPLLLEPGIQCGNAVRRVGGGRDRTGARRRRTKRCRIDRKCDNFQ